MEKILLLLCLAFTFACGEETKKKAEPKDCHECKCAECECNLEGECTCPKCDCKHTEPKKEGSGDSSDHDGPDGNDGGGCSGGTCG